MKKLLIVVLVFIFSQAHAGEGMWLPQLLKALNEGEMQSMGMKLTAEQIYSVNKGSLKDAIVHFGGFCTSELISDKGLLLTNHHCGYGQIQSHSSIEDNYLKNGFWAKDYQEEKANPGLFARFIERIEDVSDEVLKGTSDDMTPEEIQAIVNKNIDALQKAANLDNFHELMIRPFYSGNQYFAFHTVVYRDVRLVGTPPESIGKFGADTDNWVWPRHTGDFSLFRIYANPNNEPAEYSEENVPFTPKHFLPISMDGVEEGDFTMVFGFPGRTQQYLPAVAVKQIQDVLDPAKIAIRDKSLSIMDKYMRKDENAKLKYSSKFARIANYWKKWMGERQGLIKSNAVDKKRKLEDEFSKKVNNNPTYKEKYGEILSNFEKYYEEIEPYAYARDYYSEITNRNVEIFRIASYMDRLISDYENGGETAYNELMPRLQGALDNFYKNYDSSIDREVYGELITLYQSKMDANFIPSRLRYVPKEDVMKKFDNSILNKEKEVNNLLTKSPQDVINEIKQDDIYLLYIDWKDTYKEKIAKPYNKINGEIAKNQKLYMEALMKVFPSKRFWPDANSTMRVTYGQVNGYEPRDAVYYKPKTYLSGVIAKYVPGDYEFDVSDKLLELHRTEDFGPYADETGDVPVCFLGSNHTTGGNSGSPAIDAQGNLIGLNFDRVWEGTMSDINYDKSICRNIMVDIRYVLFIVDKYADAKHLVDEMKLVHPKK